MKFTQSPVGISVIPEVEAKVEILRESFPRKTVQKVLVSLKEPTKELEGAGYFYRVILGEELVRRSERGG